MFINELFESDREHTDALAQTGFWGRQAAGCIFLARDTGRYLIAHRSPYVQEPNTWGTWGGAIDAGEDPESALRREIGEEAGYYGPLLLKHLWTFKHSSGFQYHNYLAIVATEFVPQLDWETQGFAWVDYNNWPRPLHPGFIQLLQNTSLMKVKDNVSESKQLSEGILDYLRNLLRQKKEQNPNYVPITAEQRELIKQVFVNSNAHIKWTPDGDYVLPSNVHASYGTGAISFYSLNGQLMATVAHYSRRRFNVHKDRPLVHTDHTINSIADLKQLRDMLNEGH